MTRGVGRRCLAAACFVVLGCDHPSDQELSSPPALGTLNVLATIAADSFYVSGIAVAGPCEVFLVGSSWGSLVRLDLSIGTIRRVGQLPMHPRRTQLQATSSNGLMFWSQPDHVLGLIDTDRRLFQQIEVPKHPWGGRAIGAATALEDGRIAMAPLGGQLIRSPRPWREAPLVYLLDRQGRVAQHLGRVRDVGGQYLSAVWSQVSLGAVPDTLLVVRLADAAVARFPVVGSRRGAPVTAQLPKYLGVSRIWEDVWRAEWLLNGAQPRVYLLPQFSSAVFSPSGRLFVVRNGAAKWRTVDEPLLNRIYRRPGKWQVTEEWLEVYGRDGSRTGAFSLPEGGRRLVADAGGYLFMASEGGAVVVVGDPTQARACALRRRVFQIPYSDSPTGFETLKAATLRSWRGKRNAF